MTARLPITTIIYHHPDPVSGLPTRITFIRQRGSDFSVKTFRVHGDSSLRRVTRLRASYQVMTRWAYHRDEIPNLRLAALERRHGRDEATRMRRKMERAGELDRI